MEEPVVEMRSNGKANLFHRGRLWKRFDSPRRWRRVLSDGGLTTINHAKLENLLEEMYRRGKHVRRIRRFPRSGIPDTISSFPDIPLTAQIENESSRWLIEGVIRESSINLLTGPPSGFKTWLALVIAGAVSQGADFLDCETIRTPVLYLDFENPLSVIRERQKTLSLHDGPFLRIWGHWLKDSPPVIGDRRLIKIARRLHPLIIVDSLRRFHTGDENSARQMALVIAYLRRLTDAGATVLLLHHQDKSKNFKYRGSTDILAGVDAAFELRMEKSKHETILSLRCYKHRFIQEPKLTLRADLESGRFEVVDDSSDEALLFQIKKIQKAINDESGMDQKDLLEQAELPETNGRKILKQGDGIHWVSKRGKGTTLQYYPIDRSES